MVKLPFVQKERGESGKAARGANQTVQTEEAPKQGDGNENKKKAYCPERTNPESEPQGSPIDDTSHRAGE